MALIQRGGVSFGDKAALAAAAGAAGIIFVNDDGEMLSPQLEQSRDPAEFSHVPTICVTKLVGERLGKMLRSHQILRNLSDGSGYAPGDAKLHVRWWDITSGWAARRIQKQWRRAVAQRQIERRILEQNALIAEQADRLWQKTQEAAVAEAEAEHRESESLRKAARPQPTPGHNPRLPVEPETISQQQQRLAHEDAVLRARIASARDTAAKVGRGPETVMQRNKRQKTERKAAEKRSKVEAKSRRQWIGSLPFAAIEKQHAELAKRIDASKGGLDRIDQLQRTVSLREDSLREKDAMITALQKELALARLRRGHAA
eukprot:COSAG02_NODE_7898_length_2799_cov_2.162593_1_plen_316_part_00